MRFTQEDYDAFYSLRTNSLWGALKVRLEKMLGDLRAESDTIANDVELRISQGKRQMLIELVKAVDDSGKVLEKLKQNT